MAEFCVYNPTESDEDAPPISESNMLIVCDGLGGNGCNKHMVNDKLLTSAYLGSRWISEKTKEFFEANKERIFSDDTKTAISEYKDFISTYLQGQIEKYDLKKTVKGSSSEFLPSTLAMALYQEHEENVEICTIWAGDSRVYLLTSEHGLQQLSCDDVRTEFDAMENLKMSDMANNINGEGKDAFFVNYAKYQFSKQENMILFACSDGCFDYFTTPMDFEFLLELGMQNMSDSEDLSGLGTAISQFYMGTNLKDDTTIAGSILFETDTSNLKKQYFERFSYVKEHFRNKTNDIETKLDTFSDDLNKKMIRMNMGKRDINNLLMPYFEKVLSFPSPNWKPLYDRLLSLPCMEECQNELSENDKISAEIEELEQKKEEMIDSLREAYTNSAVSYFIHHPPKLNWIPKGICEQEKQIQNFCKQERMFTQSMEDVDCLVAQLENQAAELKNSIKNAPLEFSRLCDEMFKTLTSLYNCRDAVETSEEEHQNRWNLIQTYVSRVISANGLFSKSLKKEFRDVSEYDEFSDAVAKYQSLCDLEEKINDLKAQESASLKEHNIVRNLEKVKNKIVMEFFTGDEACELLPDDFQQPVMDFLTLKNEYEQLKSKENTLQTELSSLWKNDYKKMYEEYQRKLEGGRV